MNSNAMVLYPWERRKIELPDELRPYGVHLVAGRGAGKSWLLGSLIAFHDCLREIPTVIIDPMGKTINNLLDQIGSLHPDRQREIWRRVRYVDVTGRDGFIIPYPLYYHLSRESLYTISNRLIDLISRLDPNLEVAPIQGLNAIQQVGNPLGMILSALGFQITEAGSLLADPKSWESRLASLKHNPELEEPIRFFLKEYNRAQATMFKNKTSHFLLDPVMRATYGASNWAIPWRDVINDRLCVLIDTSRQPETNAHLTKINMMWIFRTLLDYLQTEDQGRTVPLSLIIDELSGLYKLGDETFSVDIDSITNIKVRNLNVWATVAHQELYQFDEKTQKALMSMGTQIIGVTSDPESASIYAKQFYRYDPLKAKRFRNVWASFSQNIALESGYMTERWNDIIDKEPVEYSAYDQLLLDSYRYHDQPAFHFLIKMGDDGLRSLRIEKPKHPFRLKEVEQVKQALMKKYGRPIADIEAEIKKRLSTDTLADYEAPTYDIPEIGDDEDEYLAPPRS